MVLTANAPLIHTLCSKLNMDDFSVLTGPLGYVGSSQEAKWNSLQAQTTSFLLHTEFVFYEVNQ